MVFYLIPTATVLMAAVVAVVLPAQGDHVTYVFGGLPRCVVVTHVDTGPDQRQWAWIVGGHAPQWTLHVRVDELVPGCVEGASETKH